MKSSYVKIVARLAIAVVVIGILISVISTLFSITYDSSKNVSEKEPISQASQQNSDVRVVKLLCVGDNLIHSPIYDEAGRIVGGNGYDFRPLYENIAPIIKTAQIAMINQETPLGGSELGISTYPNFNSPQELGNNMMEIGFNVFSHANNHVLDKGERGIAETLNYWEDKSVSVIGAYKNQEDRFNIRVIEKNGVKVSLLAYTYGTNGMKLPSGSPYMVASSEEKEKMIEEVQRAKKMSDFLVVFIHWGDEYSMTPSKKQTELAQILADNGVDVIMGSHPHVIQPVEWLTGVNGNKTLIMYSLGNFISSQQEAATMLGGIGELTLSFDKGLGSKEIKDVKFIPIITYYNGGAKNTKIYLLSQMTESLWNTHAVKKYDAKFSEKYINEILNYTISKEYLGNSTGGTNGKQN